MIPTHTHVLGLLSKDEFLSGEQIGRELGVSRMAVSKAVKRLMAFGISIASISGKGYRLENEIQLLDRDIYEEILTRQYGSKVQLHVLDSVDSTSDYLLGLQQASSGIRHVCLAERQDEGRGRRGRNWITTPYRNVIMSVAWQFENGLADLAGLGVACGITIVKALQDFGLDARIGLKWPNDIVWMDRKLGGLLIDIRGEHDGPCTAILGLGLNISLSEIDAESIDQPFTTLEKIHSSLPDRNKLTAMLISSLLETFENYPDTGFDPWQEQWHVYDRLINRPVAVLQGSKRILGTAGGINDQGALVLIRENSHVDHYYSGEVSLRLA